MVHLKRIARSAHLDDFPWRPRFVGGRYRNVGDPAVPGWKELLRWKLGQPSAFPRTPSTPAPSVAPDLDLIRSPPDSVIAATWIGHSTFLLQIAGLNLLTDPVFSDHCSPIASKRFRRLAPPRLTVSQLPKIDLILVSHAHYDHLDTHSIRNLEAPLLCPSKMGRYIGTSGNSITELGWGDTVEYGPLRIVSIPAQHGAARTPFDRDTSLWCGWLIECAGRSIYFAGDTGCAPFFPELARRFPRPDIALIPIGAYSPPWFMRPLHLDPEEAVRLHRDWNPKVSAAMHWGTFALADEPTDEPPVRLGKALRDAGIDPADFLLLNLGQTLVV